MSEGGRDEATDVRSSAAVGRVGAGDDGSQSNMVYSAESEKKKGAYSCAY